MRSNLMETLAWLSVALVGAACSGAPFAPTPGDADADADTGGGSAGASGGDGGRRDSGAPDTGSSGSGDSGGAGGGAGTGGVSGAAGGDISGGSGGGDISGAHCCVGNDCSCWGAFCARGCCTAACECGTPSPDGYSCVPE
jgi:hypothetical protein